MEGHDYPLEYPLHSSSALAAQNGTLSGAKNYYYPFGGSRGGAAFNSLTTKRFTGQYHEQSIPGGEGLSYYGARWYDARLGRFVTPDSIVPKPDNPQDFNRYSYASNSPTNFTDPTGHAACGVLGGKCGRGAGSRATGRGIFGRIGQSNRGAGRSPSRLPDFPDPFEWLAEFLGFPSNKQLQAVTGVPGMATETGRRIHKSIVVSNQVLGPTVETALGFFPGYGLATGFSGRTVTGMPLDFPDRLLNIAFAGVEFTPYDEILEVGARLGNTHAHHWIPQAFHPQIRRQFQNANSIPEVALRWTEPINSVFHYAVHGMGGTRTDAYNDAVRQILSNPAIETSTQFLEEIGRLRTNYMHMYMDFMMSAP